MSAVLFSADPDFLDAARRELQGALPGRSRADQLGPDLARLSGRDVDPRVCASAVRRRPLVFCRHLSEEVGHWKLSSEEQGGLGDDPRDCAASVAAELASVLPTRVALQVWSSGPAPKDWPAPHAWWKELAAAFADQDVEVARSGLPLTLSICTAGGELWAGLADAPTGLSDWPGGRVALAKGPEQIARSEFKLEELFRLTEGALQWPARGSMVVDLGASPGGWTRILRSRGWEVWAVDPGALDARLQDDSGIHHVSTTAGDFLRSLGSQREFDLIANDMRMEPARSCGVMLDAAAFLKPGGLGVMTLKLTGGDPLLQVNRALDFLRQRYTIVFARQLFHNRQEVTVVGEVRA